MSSLVTAEGIVHYEVNGRGEPVVLLHGWLNSWGVWRDTMLALTDSGRYRVYALDFWGWGESVGNRGQQFDLASYASMVVQFIRTMGIADAPVVGHSMGGTVALTVALTHPERVQKVAVIASPIVGGSLNSLVDLAGRERFARLVWRMPLAMDLAMRWLLARDRTGAYAMIRRDASRTSMEAFFHCIGDLRRVDLRPRLGEICMPALGVFGGRDNIVNPNQAAVMGRGIPHATIRIMQDSRHFPMRDQPGPFLRILSDFLAGQSGSARIPPSDFPEEARWAAAAMRRVVIRDRRRIAPFNEPARELRVVNSPLWLHQRDVLAPYCSSESEADSVKDIPATRGEMLVYRDNLYFDEDFIAAFVAQARASGKAQRVAFSLSDRAIVQHALPLANGIRREGEVFVADLWYYPDGLHAGVEPLVVSTEAREIGYYHVPTYMANEKGEIVYHVPLRAFLSIESWVHVFMANAPFGIFSRGARMERNAERWSTRVRLFWRSLLEHKQYLSNSALVRTGKNCQIDPTAVIQGPTTIGDNVIIGPGVVIGNCIIGSNVNIMQGCQLLLSVVGDGCYLPFRAALLMTTLMEDSMVAQNACLQLCVVGRNSFVGAGTTFTDFNLIPKPVRTMHDGTLQSTGLNVLGGCVGHNCRIGSDITIFPGRIIESDAVLIHSAQRGVVDGNVSYAESDHHALRDAAKHRRTYTED